MMRRRLGLAAIAALAWTVAVTSGCATSSTASVEPAPSALAPSGKLKVGLYSGSPTSLVGDAASADARGVSYDLGRELAKRMGAPFQPVVFPNNAKLLDAAKAGEVDIVLTNATPARAEFLDFTPTVLTVEQGYLVPAGSRIASAAEIDRAGIRVGVSQGSTSESVLKRELKQASVVPVPSLKAGGEMLAQGKLEAYATNKAILFEMSDGLPGSKVLPGRWGLELFAVGIPKGREQALPYVSKFVDAATRDGTVRRAVERAGLRGTVAGAP